MLHTSLTLFSSVWTGIGRHAAERLSEEGNLSIACRSFNKLVRKARLHFTLVAVGYRVYCGVRKEKDKNNILALNNPRLIPIIFDVTKHETNIAAIETITRDVATSKLPFVALVNNAGISRRMVAEYHDMEDIHRVFDTNVFGMMDLTKLSLPLLRESKGRIVMISSVNGRLGKSLSVSWSCIIMMYMSLSLFVQAHLCPVPMCHLSLLWKGILILCAEN